MKNQKPIFLMHGCSNFEYYFAIIDRDPCIVQKMDGRDITHATLKTLTNLSAKKYFPANMIAAAELALKNTRISMYLIMQD